MQDFIAKLERRVSAVHDYTINFGPDHEHTAGAWHDLRWLLFRHTNITPDQWRYHKERIERTYAKMRRDIARGKPTGPGTHDATRRDRAWKGLMRSLFEKEG
jgi:hypothetical protein